MLLKAFSEVGRKNHEVAIIPLFGGLATTVARHHRPARNAERGIAFGSYCSKRSRHFFPPMQDCKSSLL